MYRTTVAAALLVFSLPSFAQNQRGNTPPGLSTDGSRPADGAIQGGKAIAPGESAGMPDKVKQCEQMSGSLREQCLLKERSAAGGSSSATREPGSAPREKDNMGAGAGEPGRETRGTPAK